MCFHLDVTKYPICLFLFAWNIRFFTSSECSGSQLPLKKKSIHTQLAFLLCLLWILFTCLTPFLIFSPNHIPTAVSFFFSNTTWRNMFHREGTGAKCRCLPPLCKQWHKDKIHVFSGACSPHTALVQWGEIPHSLEFTGPFEWHKPLTNFSALQVAGAWVFVWISLPITGTEAHPAPGSCGTGFWCSDMNPTGSLSLFSFVLFHAQVLTSPRGWGKALPWLLWWLSQRLLELLGVAGLHHTFILPRVHPLHCLRGTEVLQSQTQEWWGTFLQ